MFRISRTPLRVSLFGGGSDYPQWFHRRPGAVLGFTIDKYIYISALQLTSFVDHRYRLSYSRLETGDDISAIEHPVVRAVLAAEEFDTPMDYSVQADLPANSGLGSSSAFTVGFLNLVSALKDQSRTKLELAELAIDIEQKVLRERVGIQDQLHTALGGLNHFTFDGDRFEIHPVHVRGGELDELAEWLVLIHTGIKRHASGLLERQMANTTKHRVDTELDAMVALVAEGHRAFEASRGESLARELARLLEEGWRLKKRLSPDITSTDIDALYQRSRKLGALGGKLCGAGGGGFLLLVVPPDRRATLCQELGPERCVSFRIDLTGSIVSRGF